MPKETIPTNKTHPHDPAHQPRLALLTDDASPHMHNGARYIYLWRFMVDARSQQLGFGSQAISAAIVHARARPGVKYMLLSFVPALRNPEAFYARLGFERTAKLMTVKW